MTRNRPFRPASALTCTGTPLPFLLFFIFWRGPASLVLLQCKTTVSRVLGVEGYSTYFYVLAFFKAKWLTAHGTRQLQIFQVAYARFPDKA